MNDSGGTRYELGAGLSLDLADRALSVGGRPIALAPKAFDVLAVLVQAEGRLVSRDELRQRVWGDWKPETFNANQLHFQFTKIREALKPHIDGPCIQAVPRQGFRLVLPVRRIGEAAAAGSAVAVAAPPSLPIVGGTPAAAERSAGHGERRRPFLAYGIAGGLVLLVAATTSLLFGRSDERLRVVQYTALTRARTAAASALLADRASVYYAGRGKNAALHAVPQQGGPSTLVLPESSPFGAWDIDPGGRAFLALRHELGVNTTELWRLPLASGTPTRVGDLRCSGAAWSTDGSRLACGSDAALLVAGSGGGDARAVARFAPTPTELVTFPRWSSDDTRIRFTVTRSGDSQSPRPTLWEVGSDGTGLRQVVPSWSGRTDTCCGVWSPGGDYYVFQATTDGRSDLWAIREPRGMLDGTSPPFRVTAGPMDFGWPAFSPDGSTLFAIGSQSRGELMRYDLARREFFQYLPGISGSWVTYSPDGRSIAYIGYPDTQVWRANADGTAQRQLTTGPFENSTTAWSPDGRRIAFRSRRAGQRLRIFLMPAEGGDPQPITPEDREQGTPTWSPDGARIAFGDVPSRFGIPDGGERIHVYDLATRTVGDLPGSDGLWTARWSPAPRYIAATRIRDRRLHVYDVTRRAWREIPVDHVEQLTWSRDAAWIYFHTEGGESKLRRVRVSDGRVEELANLDRQKMADISWSSLTSDGEPILLRDLGTQDVYALKLERR
jgi:DNA-binding winged helix-turn-helix (wHTH) protein/WD40 repeat protein